MIQASELRIGNRLLIDGKDVIVDNITEYGLNGYYWSDTHHGNQSGGFDYDYEFDKNKIEGIPLTEEWLLNLGFVSNPYQDRYEKKSIYVECDKTRGITSLWINSIQHIKYIHQLQNLYFALTSDELIVKES